MRGLRVLCAALCMVIGTDAGADALARARLADISGSDRLGLFAHGKLLETGAAPRASVQAMKRKLVAEAFYFDRGSRPLIATMGWVAPVLSYDGNINGGVLQDSFVFNGFVFDADPAFRARAGVVAGLSAGGMARLAWSNGRYVEARARAEVAWSPDHDIGRSNAEASLCSRNHLTGWTFADLCHTASVVNRALGSSTATQTTLSLSHLGQTGAAYHELAVDLARARYATGAQDTVTLGWGAVWDRAATKLTLTKGAALPGETALDARLAAEVTWLLGDRAVGLGLWHQRAAGGLFLGQARVDRATGISVTYQLRPGLTAQLGYMTNQSSVDFFDYAQTSMTLRYDALRW